MEDWERSQGRGGQEEGGNSFGTGQTLLRAEGGFQMNGTDW